jgi:hypothetical protein
MHDVAQTPLEAYLPPVVFARILQEIRAELIQVLLIALYPDQGTLLTSTTWGPSDEGDPDRWWIRNRAAIYAVKHCQLTSHIK